MPMKLNVGFSRKVGEPNYGSRGASIHLEVELDSGVLCDPDNMRACVHRLYALARQSVNDELQRTNDGVAQELDSGENPGEASPEPKAHREPAIERNCNGQHRQHRQQNAEHGSAGHGQPHPGRPANGRVNGANNNSAGHSVSRTAEPSNNGDTNHRNGHTNCIEVARATQSQIRAIFAITKRQGLDPHTVISERFRVHRMEDLTIREASAIIDELKSGAGVRS